MGQLVCPDELAKTNMRKAHADAMQEPWQLRFASELLTGVGHSGSKPESGTRVSLPRARQGPQAQGSMTGTQGQSYDDRVVPYTS